MTPAVITNQEHLERVMIAIQKGDEAEYRRLVFGYRQGDGFAVCAAHAEEINRRAAASLRQNRNFFARALYPQQAGPIPGEV